MDFARAVSNDYVGKKFSLRPKGVIPDMKTENLNEEEAFLFCDSIKNEKVHPVRHGPFKVPVQENFQNSEGFLSKKNSSSIKSLRRILFRRSSKIKSRFLKRPLNQIDTESSFCQAIINSRKQKLKSSISAPISNSNDICYKFPSEVAPNFNFRINIEVTKKLGKKAERNNQKSNIRKKKNLVVLRNKLLGRTSSAIYYKKHDCNAKGSSLFCSYKISDAFAKNSVNHSQTGACFSFQKFSPLIEVLTQKDNEIIHHKLSSNKKISQNYHKSKGCRNSQKYLEYSYYGPQSFKPIPHYFNLKDPPKLSSIMPSSTSAIESVSSKMDSSPNDKDLDIILSDPLTQSALRISTRCSVIGKENDYKTNPDLTYGIKSSCETMRYLEKDFWHGQEIFGKSRRQNLSKEINIIVKSQELKMMKKHPSPSKVELDRLQQAIADMLKFQL
ncbi:hypothetical protein HI914_04976 [Erysiphe necator]|nr:hypothetical protein HI914_04976 [Erysiphe necator]